MKRFAHIAGVLSLSLVLFSLGCGGGGSDSSGLEGTPPSGVVTRSDEDNYSRDAKILAAREVTGTWIPTEIASRIHDDLVEIRKEHGVLGQIRAFPDYDLNSVFVAVKPGTDWAEKWKRGDILTGEEKLDALLTEYGPSKVESQPARDTDEIALFLLKFDQPLNQKELAKKLAVASKDIVSARANLIGGNRDNILCEVLPDETRRYTFSREWGDCPSGCIYEHEWKLTVSKDDLVTLESDEGDKLGAGDDYPY